MTFEIIFGENVDHNSAEVYERVISLQQNEGCRNFSNHCRRLLVPDFEERKKANEALMKECKKKNAVENYKERLALINQAESQIVADEELFEAKADLLFAMKMYKESVAISFIGWQTFPGPKLKTVLYRAYARLGYRNGFQAKNMNWSAPESWGPFLKEIDCDDMAATIEGLLSIHTPDWESNLFYVTHLLAYLRFGNLADVYVNFKKYKNFIELLSANKKIVGLFNNLHFGSSDFSELRFAKWIMILISTWIAMAEGDANGSPKSYVDWAFDKVISLFRKSEKSLSEALAHETWYHHFVKKFAASLINRKGVTRLAELSATSYRDFVSSFLEFSGPLLNCATRSSDSVCKPFNDFHQFTSTASLAIFGANSFASNCVEIYRELFDRNLIKFEISKESFNRNFTMLLIAESYAFSAHKSTFANSLKPPGNVDMKSAAKLFKEANLVIKLIFVELAEKRKSDYILEHLTFFAYLVARFEFFAENDRELNDQGVEEFASFLTLTSATARLITSVEQVAQLADFEPFCCRFLESFTGSINFLKSRLNKDQFEASCSRTIVDLSAHLLLSKQNSTFSKLLVAEKCWQLPSFAVEEMISFSKNKLFSNRFIAAFLKSGDETARKRWGKLHANQFLCLARFLLENVTTNKKLLVISTEDALNLMIAFHVMFGRAPLIVRLHEVINNNDFDIMAAHAVCAIEDLCTLMRGGVKPMIPSSKLKPGIADSLMRLCAGLTIAVLAKGHYIYRKSLMHEGSIGWVASQLNSCIAEIAMLTKS